MKLILLDQVMDVDLFHVGESPVYGYIFLIVCFFVNTFPVPGQPNPAADAEASVVYSTLLHQDALGLARTAAAERCRRAREEVAEAR